VLFLEWEQSSRAGRWPSRAKRGSPRYARIWLLSGLRDAVLGTYNLTLLAEAYDAVGEPEAGLPMLAEALA
jgi:hypothetical protein